MKKEIIVQLNNQQNQRIDLYLTENTDLTRSHIKKLCDDGLILLNDQQVKANKSVKDGDVILLTLPENVNLDLVPENIPLDIVYQDDSLAVINKPQGLVVHAGNGTNGSTLVNALLYHLDNLSGINGVIRPGIVHRLDKNTSGLLVVAKNDNAHLKLSKQLEDKTCRRIYIALLEGKLKDDKGIVDTFINRSPKDRKKMAVSNSGRRAITEYEVLKRFDNYTLCRFSLKTGRTHQIRVHAKHLGHPVVGDIEYGYKNQKFKLNGQLLHAERLEFTHPVTEERVSFSAPIPDYFTKILKIIK